MAIISTTPNTNLSSETIGKTFTLVCQVETCVADVTVTFYKDSQVIRTTSLSNNNMRLLTFAHSLTLGEDTAGVYGCRALTSKGGTDISLFTLSGEGERGRERERERERERKEGEICERNSLII